MLLKILQICRKRSVLEYLFNKVIGIYPATLLKEKGSDISAFWWILRDIRQIPYRTPPGDCFCSTEKYFSKKKIVKGILKIENSWLRKTTAYAEKNSLFGLSLVFMIYWNKQYNSIEDLSTIENYFSPSVIWLWFQ